MKAQIILDGLGGFYTNITALKEEDRIKRNLILRDPDKLDRFSIDKIEEVIDKLDKQDKIIVSQFFKKVYANDNIMFADEIIKHNIDVDRLIIYQDYSKEGSVRSWKLSELENNDAECNDISNELKVCNYMTLCYCQIRSFRFREDVKHKACIKYQNLFYQKLEHLKQRIIKENSIVTNFLDATAGIAGIEEIETFMTYPFVETEYINEYNKEIRNLKLIEERLKPEHYSAISIGGNINTLTIRPYSRVKESGNINISKFYKITLDMPFFQYSNTIDELESSLEKLSFKSFRVDNCADKKEINFHMAYIRDAEKQLRDKCPDETYNKLPDKLYCLVSFLYRHKIYCNCIDVHTIEFCINKHMEYSDAKELILKGLEKAELKQFLSRMIRTEKNDEALTTYTVPVGEIDVIQVRKYW